MRVGERRGATVAGIADEDLVAQALAGRIEAKTILYRRHAQNAVSLATRLLGSRRDAEDVCQDAFIGALTGLGRLRDPSAFRSWLLRIVVMKVRQKLRRKRIARRIGLDSSDDDASLDRLASRNVTPEQHAELMLISAELQRMPVDERIVWMLSKVEGHSVREIAELIDGSPSTIKRRLGRAQERINRWVDETELMR